MATRRSSDGHDARHGAAAGRHSEPSEVPKTFTFDQVYDDTTKQENLYAQTASRIGHRVGVNGTTLRTGRRARARRSRWRVNEPPELRGIIPRAFHQIFDAIAKRGGWNSSRASYLEIYNEDIRDLLNKNVSNRLELKENPTGRVRQGPDVVRRQEHQGAQAARLRRAQPPRGRRR